eukprot:gene21037-23092_t
MADLKEKWKRFKGQMKAERMAKPTNNGKKESNHSQKEDNKRKELIVQQLSSHVSGKAQKYSRIAPREFAPYPFDELTFDGIKEVCLQYFSSKSGVECDVLADERGPSCKSLEQISDLKLIHIRFITPTMPMSSGTRELDLEPFVKKYRPSRNEEAEKDNYVGARSRKIFSKHLPIPSQRNKARLPSKHSKSKACAEVTSTISTVTSMPVPKSMSISQMLKMGRGKTNAEVFSLKAFKGKSITPGFCNTTWVVKRYLPEALNTNKTVGQTVEEHTKKAIQTHLLAKNFAQMLDKEVLQRDIADFCKTLMYNKIFLSKKSSSAFNTPETEATSHKSSSDKAKPEKVFQLKMHN